MKKGGSKMKFDRTMKEWGMFGSLYELFKKCMMQKQQDKRQKNLWLQCVSYGQDYMDDNGIQSLSYELAYDLYDFAASNKRNYSLTFDSDSTEKRMFTEFYTLCQKYWNPETENPDNYWDHCINDFNSFANKFSTIQGETFELPKVWSLSVLSFLDKKSHIIKRGNRT